MADDLYKLRPLEEWTEDHGDVLWWKFPVTEAPWVGSPMCLGQTVEIHAYQGVVARGMVGGWPGYHTHWTPLPDAAEMERRAKGMGACDADA